ncbi:uncharacterized protein N7503_004276 [Penicillium pulvis]|uniref:uncharacterized protein n=1 Tax=Penicillium pulvis TaxID=1562058 RepID=UPI002546B700|nr:uncharacterized protein N7503_004276 [Penicillium pulvis]KAJ5806674.1 hypothetical protein N7503_004276 [Penicillium pulvis]
MATSHLKILDDLARDLKVNTNGLLNARKLAKGYEDLVVVLIEPTDKAAEVPYTEMLAASPTLLYVNETLQFASGDQRDIDNTIVLDVRAFRSNSVRTNQSLNDQIRDDELAYSKFEQIMNILRPRVVIVCQCATEKVNNMFVRGICSSVEEAGDIYIQKFPNDHECLFVQSFHPMYYGRSEDCALKRVMREYLFDTTFIIALNALAGDRISGMGVKNLRRCAQDGPAFIVAPEGVYISYQWVNQQDVASGKLLKCLQSMERLQTISRPLEEVDRVLARYKGTEWSRSSLLDLTLKKDILEKLGGDIKPLPPTQPLAW